MKQPFDLTGTNHGHLTRFLGRGTCSRIAIAVLACCMGFSGSAKATCGPSPVSGSMLAVSAPLWQLQGPPQPTSIASNEQNGNSSIVGLWMVNFYSNGQLFDQGFDQWHQDGTEILIDNSAPQPPNGTGTACLGVYKKTGSGSYSLKHPFWIFDGGGNLIGTGLYLIQASLDPAGASYGGTFTFTTYDLNGNQTVSASGTLVAKRITVDD